MSGAKNELTTAGGKPSGHVLRLVNMLLSIKRLGGDLYFCMEGNEKRRYELLPSYKSNRAKPDFDPMPDALRLIQYMDCYIVTPEGAEADDAIATLVATSKVRSYIVSGDKDLWALLGPNVRILASGVEVTEQMVLDKLGVKPASVTLAKALCGDQSDCIPRVPGLRWSSVRSVVQQCTTPDDLYAHLNDIPTKQRKLLEENKALTYTMYDVVQLRTNCKLSIEKRSRDLAALTAMVVDEFECTSLSKQLASL